jgi:hypothetical protein
MRYQAISNTERKSAEQGHSRSPYLWKRGQKQSVLRRGDIRYDGRVQRKVKASETRGNNLGDRYGDRSGDGVSQQRQDLLHMSSEPGQSNRDPRGSVGGIGRETGGSCWRSGAEWF